MASYGHDTAGKVILIITGADGEVTVGVQCLSCRQHVSAKAPTQAEALKAFEAPCPHCGGKMLAGK